MACLTQQKKIVYDTNSFFCTVLGLSSNFLTNQVIQQNELGIVYGVSNGNIKATFKSKIKVEYIS